MPTSTEKLQATETLAPQTTNTPTQQPTSTSTQESTPGITQPLQVHYIDVGQGDAILIIAPDGQTMLIDGGETNTGIVQYLQSKGIQHLNLVVATHPHSDHIGGLVQVLNAIPVDKVITNGQSHTTSVYENFLDAIASAKAEYVEVKRGDTITLGSLVFNVLNPYVTSRGYEQQFDCAEVSITARSLSSLWEMPSQMPKRVCSLTGLIKKPIS